MHGNYKLIIHGKNIYSEYLLDPSDNETVMIGTHKKYQIRFSKDLFFEEFGLNVSFIANSWQLSCSDNIYFTLDDIRKFITKKLNYGDVIAIKYKKSHREFLRLNFLLDYNTAGQKYDLRIDLTNRLELSIGSLVSADIVITDSTLGTDNLTLYRQTDNRWSGKDDNTYYGIYQNGQKIDRGRVFTVGNYDFVMLAGYSFFLLDECLYTDQRNSLRIKLPYQIVKMQESALLYPKFIRGTRMKYKPLEGDIDILRPKDKSRPEDRSLMMSIMQPLMMLVTMVLVRGVFIGGGMQMAILSGSMMSVGMIMAIVNFRARKKKREKDDENREKSYAKYIKKKEAEIAEARTEEVRILQNLYRSFDENKATFLAFDNRMFDRDSSDADFLSVRVGTGKRIAQRPLKYQAREFQDEEDKLLEVPETLVKRYRFIPNAPVVSEFRAANAVGVIGGADRLYDLFKIMVLDLALRHFYNDVNFIVLFNSQNIEKMSWLRWLRHVKNDSLDARNLAYDDESSNAILEFMYSVLSTRESEPGRDEDRSYKPWFVVFVCDSFHIKEHPIMKYIGSARRFGFTFVFFEEAIELLPSGCNEVINITDDNENATLQITSDSSNENDFAYIPVSDEDAHKIALRMAPVYVVEASLDGDMTKNISLFELLGILSVDDLDLGTRWTNSQVDKSMAAPLGVRVKNEMVALDLHEKKHGPHGLVAGTTGSGKSEIMQSYILSIATMFHPYEVSFLIIDFKGGGMANQFEDLPHLIGAITDVDGNIDGHEIERSLLSIRAELDKRKMLFSNSRVNHIDDYIKLYKKNNSMTPLPHLIILVDEFAELKSEQPEFMKELISAARVGRSLGVHLILATQKPSGVIDPQIWSNSKFKLCLKVQTKEDSNEVLKTPLAAEIVEPGRAYLQVGNNELFILFQSAYSGAKVPSGSITRQNIFNIQELSLWGKKTQVFTNKTSGGSDDDAKNQLQAVVEYVNAYCESNSIPKLNSICLPPLRTIIHSDEFPQTPKNLVAGITVTVGQYDDPEQQSQNPLIINLSTSNTFIMGSSQTGKTTLLQTILRDIVSTYTPEEVNLYVIDCGNMSLKVFESSRLTGGVVLPAEEERVSNLIKMLYAEITNRKNIFAQNLVGTYGAYVEAGFSDLPHIFVVIENITAFREFYMVYDTDLFTLSRDGQSVGVNLILTASQSNAVSYKILSNFGVRVALNCNDKGEYASILDRCRIQPKDTPGRGLCVIEKRILEFQVALCVKGNTEKERTESLQSFIESRNLTYGSSKAKPIPMVPEIIKESELYLHERELFALPYQLPIGLAFSNVQYNYLNLLKQTIFAVIGRDKSGKTNFVLYVLSILHKTIFTGLTEAYILDSANRALEPASGYGYVEEYSIDVNDAEYFLDSILAKLEKRQELLNEKRGLGSEEELLADQPLLLLVVENPTFVSAVCKDKELYAKFVKITKEYKNLKVAVLFCSVENTPVGITAPDMLKQIKEAKQAIIFEDLTNIRIFDVGLKYQKLYPKPITIGDGYFLSGNEIEKLKTVLHTQ